MVSSGDIACAGSGIGVKSERTLGTPSTGLGFWLTVFAALLALLITAIVVSANAYSLRKLRDNQILASVVPAAGALRGLRALDGSEWIPSEDPKHMLVLFGLPDFDQQGGYDFWRDVAARSGSVSPGLQFVGLCIASIRCNQSARDGSALTILSNRPVWAPSCAG